MQKVKKKKKLDGRKLSHQYCEEIRLEAIHRVLTLKESPELVISSYGLHRSCVYRWLKEYNRNGKNGLKSKKAKGPKKKTKC